MLGVISIDNKENLHIWTTYSCDEDNSEKIDWILHQAVNLHRTDYLDSITNYLELANNCSANTSFCNIDNKVKCRDAIINICLNVWFNIYSSIGNMTIYKNDSHFISLYKHDTNNMYIKLTQKA